MKTAINQWITEFETAVSTQDYERGALLFANEVYSFGTVANHAHGKQELVERQWKVVWEQSDDFTFNEYKLVHYQEAQSAVIAALWTSRGHYKSGECFERCGRATILLTYDGSTWRSTHTHFSISPVETFV